MFEFKTLDQWLNEYEESLVNDLLELKELVAYARKEIIEQTHTDKEVWEDKEISEKFRGYTSWKLPKKYEIHQVEFWGYRGMEKRWALTAIINLKGKEYRHDYMGGYPTYSDKVENALLSFVKTYGFSKSHVKLIEDRDVEWIKNYAKKEREALKKSLEMKVEKICGKSIAEVIETPGDGLYLKGSNDKVAHLWKITAGGYNIQRLHTRVLVKEVRK